MQSQQKMKAGSNGGVVEGYVCGSVAGEVYNV